MPFTIRKVVPALTPSLFLTLRRGYGVGMLLKDISAGFTVGVVALPLALAFAIASGLSPVSGLYTAVVAGFVMAFFSGSRFPVSGPTGAFVVIIYNIVSRHGYDGLVLTTLMAGILLILFGVLRLGSLIKFIPYPVTTGFTAGIALLIFSSQMKDFLGLPLAETPPEFLDKWHVYARHAAGFSPATVAVALLTLGVIIAVRRKIPRIPAPVAAVTVATLLVTVSGMPVETIGSRFGELSGGLPSFHLPENFGFEQIRLLLPDALTIALLAGIESLLACVVADSMTGDRHNSNTELVAQGLGNMAAVFFGGFPATGAIARTATNVRAGAQSPVSAIVHALFLAAVLLWFLPFMECIPLASLAAVLVTVAWDMCGWKGLRHMFHGPKSDWSVMLLTFALTVILDLTIAVYMGVVLASLLFMRRMSELTRIHSGSADQPPEALPDLPLHGASVPDGVQIFSINGPLFFGVADRFQRTLEAMEKPPKVFILYLHNTPSIDMTGIHALETFLGRRSSQCRIFLADMQDSARRTLTRAGIVRALGEENIFPTLDAALDRAREVLASS